MDYSPEVRARFASLAGAGSLAPGPGTVVEGAAGSTELGAQVLFRARVADGCLAALAFQAFACPHTLAVCSIAVERLQGQPVPALGRFDVLAAGRDVGVPPAKTSRLMIIQDALRNCLADWDNRRFTQAHT